MLPFCIINQVEKALVPNLFVKDHMVLDPCSNVQSKTCCPEDRMERTDDALKAEALATPQSRL